MKTGGVKHKTETAAQTAIPFPFVLLFYNHHLYKKEGFGNETEKNDRCCDRFDTDSG